MSKSNRTSARCFFGQVSFSKRAIAIIICLSAAVLTGICAFFLLPVLDLTTNLSIFAFYLLVAFSSKGGRGDNPTKPSAIILLLFLSSGLGFAGASIIRYTFFK